MEKCLARFGVFGKLSNGKCKPRATEEGKRQANARTKGKRRPRATDGSSGVEGMPGEVWRADVT